MALLNLKFSGLLLVCITLVAVASSHPKKGKKSSEESPYEDAHLSVDAPGKYSKTSQESPEDKVDGDDDEDDHEGEHGHDDEDDHEDEHGDERIIRKYTDVETGVPVDFRYNESRKGYNSDELNSVPGCPKSEHGVPWIYYGRPPKCYLAGERGPCPADQVLFMDKYTPFGYCNCACFKGSTRAAGNQVQFCEVDHQRFVIENAFVPNLKRCYELYEQGPCKDKEWLAKVSSTQVQCEERQCEDGKYPATPMVVGKISCQHRVAGYNFVNGVGPNDCKSPEKYSSLLKKCIASSKVKF